MSKDFIKKIECKSEEKINQVLRLALDRLPVKDRQRLIGKVADRLTVVVSRSPRPLQPRK